MFKLAYSFSLHQDITEGVATIIRLDGKRPSLVCGIVGGKLIVHTPHKTEEINSAGETRLLNINKKMVSLTAGCIQFNSEKEVLMIATQNNLKVYDVIENSDLFYHEVSDGICSVVFGSLAPLKRPVVIIGGNCFVNGFDENGDEVYWVVGGDNVLSMVLCDIDDDSTNELITGWEDYSIRVFKGEYQWLDVTESAAVVKLAAFSTRMFAFGLANGTIGAYLVKARAWSYKTKEKIISIVPFNDSRNDPFAFIFVYASGLIEARELVKGTVIGSEKLGTPLVYGVRCDYRMQGSEQLLVVQTNGGVKGFDVNNKPLVVIKKEGEKENEEEEVSMRPENDITAQNASEFGDLLIELQRKKAELNIELNQFNNQKKSSNLTADMVIPNTTQLFCDYVYPSGVRYPCLQLKTNNSSIIKALIVYGEKLFEKDHSAIVSQDSTNMIRFPLRITKPALAEITMKVLIGNSPTSQYYQVFELSRTIPKFVNFYFVKNFESLSQPKSTLTCTIRERVPRITKWLNQCFVMSKDILQKMDSQETFKLELVNVINAKTCVIRFDYNNNFKFVINHDDMETAGEIIQDLCQFLNINELESTADFPEEKKHLENVVNLVNEYNAVRAHQTADIAESIANLKLFLVKAEDSRITDDM